MRIVKVKNVHKSFQSKVVFENINLEVDKGEFVVIMGESGSGKSTLLNMIGLLDKPDSGDIILFDQKNIKPFSRKAEIMLREKIGYLFQNFALVDNETVEYNLALALDNVRGNKKEKIKEALKTVGLEGYEKKKIYKCSGGEQQRIALARLLLKPCELILADEPTGSLDAHNKEKVCQLLKQMQKDGKTNIKVTHDESLKEYATQDIKI